MTTNFPTSKDNFVNPSATDEVAVVSHSEQHTKENDAIYAIETKLGIDGSTDVNSHDFKLSDVSSGDKAVAKIQNDADLASVNADIATLQTADLQNVKITGDQNISGIKTFSNSPVIPGAVNNTDAVNKNDLDTAISLNQGSNPLSIYLGHGSQSSPIFTGVTASVGMIVTQNNSSSCYLSLPTIGWNIINNGARVWSISELNSDIYILGTGTFKKFVASDGYTNGINITISGGTITVASLTGTNSLAINYLNNNFYIRSGNLIEIYTLSGTTLNYVSSFTLSPTTAFSGTVSIGISNGTLFAFDTGSGYLLSFDASGVETYKSDYMGFAEGSLYVLNDAVYILESNANTLMRMF